MFDLTKDYSDKNAFTPIPEGEYAARLETAKWVPTSKGPEQLNLQFSIIGEKYANRRVFENLNLFNPSEKTKNIAMNSLKNLLMNAGVNVSKLSQISKDQLIELLSDIVVGIKVKIEPAKNNYPEKNVIRGYLVAPSSHKPITTEDIPF